MLSLFLPQSPTLSYPILSLPPILLSRVANIPLPVLILLEGHVTLSHPRLLLRTLYIPRTGAAQLTHLVPVPLTLGLYTKPTNTLVVLPRLSAVGIVT